MERQDNFVEGVPGVGGSHAGLIRDLSAKNLKWAPLGLCSITRPIRPNKLSNAR